MITLKRILYTLGMGWYWYLLFVVAELIISSEGSFDAPIRDWTMGTVCSIIANFYVIHLIVSLTKANWSVAKEVIK